ncbi:MAG TPA: UDP-N-acetylmuramoyl-tripeptide--D-alanyl-D-alanine ligase [Chloroflexota bacterium]|jgi:UDP-N-acetylmuramoyl-tripeptide--D-alanyl-D-alanine ligase
MADLGLDFLLRHVGAHTLPYRPSPRLRFTSITNDSRTVQPGALFLAIAAERDGHEFIADARARGAVGVLASRIVPLDDWLPEDERASFAYVAVDNPVAGLQRVAAAHREALEVGVIGVVGSVGKTTTKEVLAQVLRRRFKLLASWGNFNNEIGLPIVLLELTDEHERAILEMGAYKVGEIAELCRIAQPQVGVVTTIGPTHLESFGSLDATEEAKGEIVEALPETGLAVLNGDDERVSRIALRASCPVAWYGVGERNLIRATAIETRGLEGIAFTLLYPGGSLRIESPLIGRHSVYPCLAAAAVATADEMPEAEIASALAEPPARLRLRPLPGRNGSTILDDSYNAAPISAAAALDVLSEHGRRRVAVLGDMLELGEVEEEAHRTVGRRVAAAADVLYAVGRRARLIGEEAERAGLGEVHYADDALSVGYEPRPGDLVLVKGSRGMRLERLVQKLVEPGA